MDPQEARRLTSMANGPSGWQLNGPLEPNQGLSHMDPSPGNPMDLHYPPMAPTMAPGWPSMQYPSYGRAKPVARIESPASYYTDSNVWDAPEQWSNRVDSATSFAGRVHGFPNQLDFFPSANVLQGFAPRVVHERIEYTQVSPQGGIHGHPSYHTGSGNRGQGNYSPPRHPVEPFVTPPGAPLPDQPILRTPSPGNSNHDSPGAPGTPYRDRIESYVAQNDAWSPEKARWIANAMSSMDGLSLTSEDPGRSQPQSHYPHGQWISLETRWNPTLFLASEDERLQRPTSTRTLVKYLLTSPTSMCSHRQWYGHSVLSKRRPT